MGVLAMPIAACDHPPLPSSPVSEAPQEHPAPATMSQALAVEIATLPTATPEIMPKVARPVVPRLLPESIIGAPEAARASRHLEYNTTTILRTPDTSAGMAWYFRRTTVGQIVGFEFSNHGGNRILPPLRDGAHFLLLLFPSSRRRAHGLSVADPPTMSVINQRPLIRATC